MANRLKERRAELKLSQPQVSAELKKIEPHIDAGMVSRYEHGVCLPTPAQLEGLETVLQADRAALYDLEDLDLLGAIRGHTEPPTEESEHIMGSPTKPSEAGSAGRGGAAERLSPCACAGAKDAEHVTTMAPPPSHVGRFRKCYRISREFAASLPDDLLQVCGYSSWQSWHDAAMKRLLAEYAARKRAGKKGGKTA